MWLIITLDICWLAPGITEGDTSVALCKTRQQVL